MTAKPSQTTFLVDAHVHIYDCFDINIFLSAAHDNFSMFDQTPQDSQSSSAYFLLLSEGKTANWFQKLKQFSDNDNLIQNWSIKKTTEDITLLAQHKTLPDKKLFIVAGRQIVTAENLEVLALFTDKLFTERNTLDKTIQDVRADNAIAVIPWGTGKWFGRRGRILTCYLNTFPCNSLLLGDNRCRPTFWPTPYLFNLAFNKTITILPGSDPLPLSTEQNSVGKYGFKLFTTKEEPKTAEQIKKALINKTGETHNFGRRQNLCTFVKNQIRLRIKNN